MATLAFGFQPDMGVLRKVYEDAVVRREREFGAQDPRTAQAARDLGFFLKGIGDSKSAVPAFSKAVRIDEVKYGPTARRTLADVVALASVSNPREAEPLLLRAVASADPEIAGPALATLGDLHQAAGDRAGAAAYWRQALARAEAAYGNDGAVVNMILNSLAQAVDARESVTLLERALENSRRALGERHPETATCEVNVARALLKAKRAGDAVDAARQGLAGFEATMGPQHPRVAAAASTLANALRDVGNRAEAEALYRRALEIDRLALGAADKQTVHDAQTLTAFLREGSLARTGSPAKK